MDEIIWMNSEFLESDHSATLFSQLNDEKAIARTLATNKYKRKVGRKSSNPQEKRMIAHDSVGCVRLDGELVIRLVIPVKKICVDR